MVNLKDILNVRYSTRNLSDADFESAVPFLAKELETVNYYPTYTDQQLKKDWKDLCSWTTNENYINSTSRLGLKLCEHFNHNFYDIENANGISFTKLWKSENLEKILRWNRKSHSTPYLSELKRGIYFCCGLPKSTMYRPQMMKLACIKYEPEIVLDPCAGWGGRMLGAVSYGARYIAFEPNTKTFQNLNNLANYLGIQDQVTLICDDARNMSKYNLPKVDLVLTSPPYFDLEIYTHENTQSVSKQQTYQDWADNFLREIILLSLNQLTEYGVSCWNVGKVRNRDMNIDVEKYHNEFNFIKIDVLSVTSSKRQMHQNLTKNSKNMDNTIVFSEEKII